MFLSWGSTQRNALAASAPPFNRASVSDYTEQLLRWWRDNHPTIPAWCKGARIAFAMSCTSAASERVFSLVNTMFGEDQLTALADQVETATMLRLMVARLAKPLPI